MSIAQNIDLLSFCPSISLDLIPPTSFKELQSRISCIALESLFYFVAALSSTFATVTALGSAGPVIGAVIGVCGLISTLFCLIMSMQLCNLYLVGKSYSSKLESNVSGVDQAIEKYTGLPRIASIFTNYLAENIPFKWPDIRKELFQLMKNPQEANL